MVADCPPAPPIEHGTISAYTHGRCSCELCKKAGRDYRRRNRFRNRPVRDMATRRNIALSILNHRAPTEDTLILAIRALRGFDVIAEAAEAVQ